MQLAIDHLRYIMQAASRDEALDQMLVDEITAMKRTFGGSQEMIQERVRIIQAAVGNRELYGGELAQQGAFLLSRTAPQMLQKSIGPLRTEPQMLLNRDFRSAIHDSKAFGPESHQVL